MHEAIDDLAEKWGCMSDPEGRLQAPPCCCGCFCLFPSQMISITITRLAIAEWFEEIY